MSAESWLYPDYQKNNANGVFCLQTRSMQSISLLSKLMGSIGLRDARWCVKWNYWEQNCLHLEKMSSNRGTEITLPSRKEVTLGGDQCRLLK